MTGSTIMPVPTNFMSASLSIATSCRTESVISGMRTRIGTDVEPSRRELYRSSSPRRPVFGYRRNVAFPAHQLFYHRSLGRRCRNAANGAVRPFFPSPPFSLPKLTLGLRNNREACRSCLHAGLYPPPTAHAIPILVGVNLITFALFFVVNTPDDMARMQLGVKRVTPEAIEKWKAERGYDKPLLWERRAAGAGKATETIFFQKSALMFAGDFGRAEDGRDMPREIRTRMVPSLAIALPTFLFGLFVTISFALALAFFRATAFDFWGVVVCVAMMSISGLFYIIGGQYLFSKMFRLVPISGYSAAIWTRGASCCCRC